MLVTFHCNAHENVTYLGDVARQLLKMMGHSGVIPSALSVDDVSPALTHLLQALEQRGQNASQAHVENDMIVSLRHRALPLIHLLQAAIEHKKSVTWAEGL